MITTGLIFAGSAQASLTVLIDFDDSIADNGIHDSSVRNGGFEEGSNGQSFADTPVWSSYFSPEGDSSGLTSNTNVATGSLRGLAHAGAPNDEGCVILAFELRPTQLRIGRKIGFPPKRDEREGSGGLAALLHLDRSGTRAPATEVAFVREGQITLEEYRGHLPI